LALLHRKKRKPVIVTGEDFLRNSKMTSYLQCLTGVFLTTMVLLWSNCVYGEANGDALRSYAVTIMNRPAKSEGNGIYLGNGLVLTAAHVASSASNPKPSVRFGDRKVPATFIKEGNFEQVDLAVLLVDIQELPADIRNRHLALCKDPPWPADEVVVVTRFGTRRSEIIAPQPLFPAFRQKFTTLISDVQTSGKSGSGVIDHRNKCLLGILSAIIKVRPDINPKLGEKALGTYFVPAWTIESFIPSPSRP
jgi:S1-C subfamily serine protease